MRRREFIALVGTAATWPIAVGAQPPEPVRQIGALIPFEAQDAFGREIIAALRQGLEERGWTEGRNIHIEERWIGANDERRAAYASELVQSSPDVIFACFAGQLAALSRETRAIPIVFVGVSDPVAAGYVESFVRPGAISRASFSMSPPSSASGWAF